MSVFVFGAKCLIAMYIYIYKVETERDRKRHRDSTVWPGRNFLQRDSVHGALGPLGPGCVVQGLLWQTFAAASPSEEPKGSKYHSMLEGCIQGGWAPVKKQWGFGVGLL